VQPSSCLPILFSRKSFPCRPFPVPTKHDHVSRIIPQARTLPFWRGVRNTTVIQLCANSPSCQKLSPPASTFHHDQVTLMSSPAIPDFPWRHSTINQIPPLSNCAIAAAIVTSRAVTRASVLAITLLSAGQYASDGAQPHPQRLRPPAHP
jgi:hypothetical protein